jgi:hypothetical protein
MRQFEPVRMELMGATIAWGLLPLAFIAGYWLGLRKSKKLEAELHAGLLAGNGNTRA